MTADADLEGHLDADANLDTHLDADAHFDTHLDVDADMMLMLILIFDATDTESQRADGTGERRVERRKADKGVFDQLLPAANISLLSCFFFQICYCKVSKNFHF